MAQIDMVTPEQTALAATAAAAAEGQPRPGLGELWRALEGVPDPELPVVSVIELGMVRAIEWDAADPALLVVKLTPTYSGCPATELIMTGIQDAVLAAGAPAVRIDLELSPPWTTDWLSAEAQRKLRAYGIAPPGMALPADPAAPMPIDVTGISPLRRAAFVVPCPRCGSTRTQLVAQFGSTACKAQYRCTDCLEPFDFFKPH